MKLKTHKGTKKRFKVSKQGKIKRWRAGGSHLLSKKKSKRKRKLKQSTLASKSDLHKIRGLLPYG